MDTTWQPLSSGSTTSPSVRISKNERVEVLSEVAGTSLNTMVSTNPTSSTIATHEAKNTNDEASNMAQIKDPSAVGVALLANVEGEIDEDDINLFNALSSFTASESESAPLIPEQAVQAVQPVQLVQSEQQPTRRLPDMVVLEDFVMNGLPQEDMPFKAAMFERCSEVAEESRQHFAAEVYRDRVLVKLYFRCKVHMLIEHKFQGNSNERYQCYVSTGSYLGDPQVNGRPLNVVVATICKDDSNDEVPFVNFPQFVGHPDTDSGITPGWNDAVQALKDRMQRLNQQRQDRRDAQAKAVAGAKAKEIERLEQAAKAREQEAAYIRAQQIARGKEQEFRVRQLSEAPERQAFQHQMPRPKAQHAPWPATTQYQGQYSQPQAKTYAQPPSHYIATQMNSQGQGFQNMPTIPPVQNPLRLFESGQNNTVEANSGLAQATQTKTASAGTSDLKSPRQATPGARVPFTSPPKPTPRGGSIATQSPRRNLAVKRTSPGKKPLKTAAASVNSMSIDVAKQAVSSEVQEQNPRGTSQPGLNPTFTKYDAPFESLARIGIKSMVHPSMSPSSPSNNNKVQPQFGRECPRCRTPQKQVTLTSCCTNCKELLLPPDIRHQIGTWYGKSNLMAATPSGRDGLVAASQHATAPVNTSDLPERTEGHIEPFCTPSTDADPLRKSLVEIVEDIESNKTLKRKVVLETGPENGEVETSGSASKKQRVAPAPQKKQPTPPRKPGSTKKPSFSTSGSGKQSDTGGRQQDREQSFEAGAENPGAANINTGKRYGNGQAGNQQIITGQPPVQYAQPSMLGTLTHAYSSQVGEHMAQQPIRRLSPQHPQVDPSQNVSHNAIHSYAGYNGGASMIDPALLSMKSPYSHPPGHAHSPASQPHQIASMDPRFPNQNMTGAQQQQYLRPATPVAAASYQQHYDQRPLTLTASQSSAHQQHYPSAPTHNTAALYQQHPNQRPATSSAQNLRLPQQHHAHMATPDTSALYQQHFNRQLFTSSEQQRPLTQHQHFRPVTPRIAANHQQHASQRPAAPAARHAQTSQQQHGVSQQSVANREAVAARKSWDEGDFAANPPYGLSGGHCGGSGSQASVVMPSYNSYQSYNSQQRPLPPAIQRMQQQFASPHGHGLGASANMFQVPREASEIYAQHMGNRNGNMLNNGPPAMGGGSYGPPGNNSMGPWN